jgi:hypothetical protein
VRSVVAVSTESESTYLIDCGRGWGCVYSDGWIDEPHRLEVLLADGGPRFHRRGPWSTRFAVLESEVLKRAEAAVRDAQPAVRARFRSLGLS